MEDELEAGLFEILKNRNPNWAERLREGDPIIERQRKIEEIQDLIERLDPYDYSV
jgi:hypothetical protein